MTTAKRGARKAKSGEMTSEARLFAVATEEFSRKGFEGTPIRQIAQAAGITLPTIYHYFGDKRALYERVCITVFEQQNRAMQAALTKSDVPAIRLLHFTTTLIASLEDVQFSRLLQRELIDQDFSLIADTTRAALLPHFEIVRSTVEALGDYGDGVERSIAIYSLAFGLIQLSPVWQQLGRTEVAGRSTEETALHILRIIFPETKWAHEVVLS